MSTGGPAFPVPDLHHANGQVQYGSDGMTLLDWFAGQVLAGLIDLAARHDCVTVDDIAKDTYNQAAAMVAEKARREAVVKESSTSDHSGDANKMVEDHFRGVTEMTELEAQNRELLERIKRLEEAGGLALGYASKGDFESADEVWSKAKETKP